eukprot:GCRY01008183.1.p3 GENE.GCRY01008183.1~~GCRY01008183.1.p3  ORF type:complete len:116 (-),score=10.43 GCRY01008183.1:1060-1407(-)
MNSIDFSEPSNDFNFNNDDPPRNMGELELDVLYKVTNTQKSFTQYGYTSIITVVKVSKETLEPEGNSFKLYTPATFRRKLIAKRIKTVEPYYLIYKGMEDVDGQDHQRHAYVLGA